MSELRSCFLHGDYTGKDDCPTCKAARAKTAMACTCGSLTGKHDADCESIPEEVRAQWEAMHDEGGR